MAISQEVLASYSEYRYRFEHSPHSYDIFESDQINCQTFTHKFYKEQFGVNLPLGMWSKEIVSDRELIFRDVDVLKEEISYGDIIAFVPKEIPENVKDNPEKAYHLAIFVGRNEEEESQFIHANYTDNGVSIWTLEQFSQRYEGIGAIKRVQDPIHTIFVQPIAARQEVSIAV